MAGKKSNTLTYTAVLNANPFVAGQQAMKSMSKQCAEQVKSLNAELKVLNERLVETSGKGENTAGLEKQIKALKTEIATAKENGKIWKQMSEQQYYAVDKLSKVVQEKNGVMTRSWNQLNEIIRQANRTLKNFGNEANMKKLENELKSSGMTLSEYQTKLNETIAAAKARMAELAAGFTNVVDQARRIGATSVEEGQRMIMALSEVRKAVNNGTAEGKAKMAEVDEAINKVTADMERLAINSSDVQRALNAINTDGSIKKNSTAFDGNINSLERMKASLVAWRRTLETSGKKATTEFRKVENAIRQTDERIKLAGMSTKTFNAIVANPKLGSMHELEKVISVLETRYKGLNEKAKEYNKTAMQLREARTQLKLMNDNMKTHASTIDQVISRLKSYVLVYMGFNQFLNVMPSWISSNLELSDSLSDIQKRTRLSDDAIKEISKTIDSIDTRTSQQQLHELAATAGLLGLKSKEDIIGFTRAANEMSVALKELGSEGAAQLMKIATLTGDVANYGVEQALVKTGSAINELTASSAASAGPIVNFISRMGAVGSQARLTMGDLAGIGATLDALGQPIELSATAMNRFIMSLRGNSAGLATALGIDTEQINAMMEAGKTMEAMVLVLEKMSERKGGVAVLGQVFDEMGSEGVRLKQTISSLIGNVDFLRRQVSISNQAFEEGVSVVNEYNIKNENSAAIMERTGNMIREYFTNADAVDSWKGLASMLYIVVKAFLSMGGVIKTLLALWLSLKINVLAAALAQSKFNAEQHKTLLGTAIRAGLLWLRKGYYTLTKNVNAAKTATKSLGEAQKALSMTNPYSAILTVVSTLAITFMPELISKFKIFSKEVDTAEKATKRLTEAQDRMRAVELPGMSEKERLLKMQVDYMATLNKDSEEYANTRDRIIAQNANELGQLSDRIKSFRGIKDYQDEFLSLIGNINERSKALELAEKLKQAEAAAEDALRALRPLKPGTEEYAKAQNKATDAMERYNTLLAEMSSKYQEYANTLANQISGVNNYKLALDLLTKSIYDNARAEVKANAIRQEADVRNEIFTAFRKDFIKKATGGNSWIDRVFGQTRQKTVSEDEANQMLGQVMDYLLNPDEGASMSNVLKGWLGQFNVTQSYSGGIKRNINSVEALVAEARMKMIRSLQNTKVFETWADNIVDLGTKNTVENAPNMKAGWDRESYFKETEEMLNKRSELLHLEWNKYREGSDMTAFNKYVGKTFSNYSEATKWVKEVVKEMKDVAKNRGWALAGNWTWPTEKGDKGHKTRESDSAIAELDRYYSLRKQLIEKARIEEGLSEAEYNRRLDANEQEHLQKRHDLRETFTTKDAATVKRFREWWKSVEELDKIEWGKIEKEWDKADEKNKKQNDAQAQKDLTDMEAITVKQLNRIANIISKERPYDGITRNLQDNLTEMGILFADLDEVNETFLKEGRDRVIGDATYVFENAKRVAFLLGEAEHAYSITAEDLLKKMTEEGLEEWAEAIGKRDDMKTALMAQLRTAYDAVQDAIKKEATAIKKQMDIAWNDTIFGNKSMKNVFEDWLSGLAQKENSVRRANELINAGYASEKVADKLALKQMQVRMRMQQTYYAMLRKIWKERIDALVAAGKLEDAEHAKKSRDLSLSEEQKKIEEQRVAIMQKLEESQNNLYKNLMEWGDLLAGSLKTLFEASNAGNEQFYNDRAKLLYEQRKGISSGEKKEYYIIENAGTADAKVTEELLTDLEALERQHEIDQHNAIRDAWREVMDSFSDRMNEFINDQINAMLQNAALNDNTTALGRNTEAMQILSGYIESLANSGADGGGASGGGGIGESLADNLLGMMFGGGQSGNGEVPEYLAAPTGGSSGFSLAGLSDWGTYAEESSKALDTISGNMDKMKSKQKQTDNAMMTSSQSAFAKMTQAANLYGIAYQAMSNDNLSAAQKFGMIAVQSAGQAAITGLTVSMAETNSKVAVDTPAVLSKLWKQLGWAAVPVYAIFTGLLGGLMGLATSKIAKGKSEIAAATNAGRGKLVTGMLTYAEGNYPVLGADGKTYNARYEGKPQTGIYSGGARFGIFSEKKPEAIIDGDTTERILLDYPKIWQDILTIKRHGRLKEAMPAYASGNIEELVEKYGGDARVRESQRNEGNERSEETKALTEAIETLNAVLASGIGVRMNGDDGLDKSLAKRNRFKQRMHID